MEFGGQNLEVAINWPGLQIPIRMAIVLDIVDKSIQPRAFSLYFPLWTLLLNVPSSFVQMRSCSSCLFSRPKCFRNSPQTGWIVSLGYEQIVWVMRQVGKDSGIKKGKWKSLSLAFRVELGHKGNFVNHVPFVIRMVEAFFSTAIILSSVSSELNQLLTANRGVKNFPDTVRQNQLTLLDKGKVQFWLENQVRWGTRLTVDMVLVWKGTLVQDLHSGRFVLRW